MTLFSVSYTIIAVFTSTGEDILTSSRRYCTLHPDDQAAASCINSFIFKVQKISLSNRLIAVPLEDIIQKCIHIPLKYSPTDFIVTLPNVFEHH